MKFTPLIAPHALCISGSGHRSLYQPHIHIDDLNPTRNTHQFPIITRKATKEKTDRQKQARQTDRITPLATAAMAPSFVTIDTTADFDFTSLPTPPKQPTPSTTRTLLLAPPSLASHEPQLRAILSLHDRSLTDLHMLDRLSANLVPLPPSTYSLILLLTDAAGSRADSAPLLTRDVYAKLVQALKPAGKLQAQDDVFARPETAEYTEAILAGLVPAADGMVKPDDSASEAVPLRFGRKKKAAAESAAASAPATPSKSVDGTATGAVGAPSGVGFVDFSDDFGEPIVTGEEEEDEDELIDEDTLFTDADLQRMVVVRT